MAVAGAMIVAGAACASHDDARPHLPPTATGKAAKVPAKPGKATVKPVKDCARQPAPGRVNRSGYGMDYTVGAVYVEVAPFGGGDATCTMMGKSGPADPQVPGDTLLLSFAATGGRGAQIEFSSIAFTGGIPPVNGTVVTPGPLTQALDATVGVSLDGKYLSSSQCTVSFAEVTRRRTAGRFECPSAQPWTANPFDPTDDVDYDAAAQPSGPAEASLSGWFELKH
ncbi:MAG: hypothetical protein QM774_08055 [Gordonia sp. (in: high G+C Gram-positive bacteria)]|uniref:hypothetical protein n=1 Tax=Gordonia sp. (in: high G+C Gram-positive bacteria) TaxID=84139 RepID=UPI0039E476F1